MPNNISVHTLYDCVPEVTPFHELVLRLLQGTVASQGRDGQVVYFTLFKREDANRYPEKYAYWLKCQGMRASWAKSSLHILTTLFGIKLQVFDYNIEDGEVKEFGCKVFFDRNVLEIERVQFNSIIFR